MADDSRRSGGVSGLELLSGRRIRIEKKMLKNLKEMEKRKTEILNKKSEAEKIFIENMLTRNSDLHTSNSVFRDYLVNLGVKTERRWVSKTKTKNGNGNEAPLLEMMMAGHDESFDFPGYTDDDGEYVDCYSKVGWEQGEIAILFGIDKASLSRRLQRLEVLFPEKMKGITLEGMRGKGTYLYHEKIFELLFELEEKDYLDRFSLKAGTNKEQVSAEIRKIWDEVKQSYRGTPENSFPIFY